jgi:hypothetical protein
VQCSSPFDQNQLTNESVTISLFSYIHVQRLNGYDGEWTQSFVAAGGEEATIGAGLVRIFMVSL